MTVNADTAIVGKGGFIHYCHTAKTLVYLRNYHRECMMCKQANPDYIESEIIHYIMDMENNGLVMTFSDFEEATNYYNEHQPHSWILGTVGHVSKTL